MKSKTIKSVLRKKLKAWCDSIDDPAVREIVNANTIITGGAITSLLLNDKPNDFDVYFRTREAADRVIRYYIGKLLKNPPTKFKGENGEAVPITVKTEDDRIRIVVKSSGVATESGSDSYEYFEQTDPANAEEFVDEAMQAAASASGDDAAPFRPVFVTSNALTLSDGVQIVARFFGEPDEIHENYDFVHCKNYWTSWDGFLSLKAEALECIINKELRYVGSKYPVCSLFRMRKFLDRGWQINAGQILKAALQISELDLSNPEVLEEQLIGVDAAYFTEVLNLCRKRLEETGEKSIDQTYLVELIDRIF